MTLVNVQYFGKRLPWTLTMPWLAQPVTFGSDRIGQMVSEDAVKLCADCPRDFKIIGPVIVDSAPVEKTSNFVVHALPDVIPPTKRIRKRSKNKE